MTLPILGAIQVASLAVAGVRPSMRRLAVLGPLDFNLQLCDEYLESQWTSLNFTQLFSTSLDFIELHSFQNRAVAALVAAALFKFKARNGIVANQMETNNYTLRLMQSENATSRL